LTPLIIAHRGASGDRPEHTLAAYRLAIEHGADFIEPDLVLTRDGVLVARHENEIGGTTDVATRAEFAARRTVKTIDGVAKAGWFTEDFTLAELKTLRARERIPELRPANRNYDDQFDIPTFDEILELVRDAGRARGEPPGVYPETKHPSYFSRIGLDHETPLLEALRRFGYSGAHARVFIQSFEIGNLRALRAKSDLPLVQLLELEGAPFDSHLLGAPRSYRDLAGPQGLREIAEYANAIGPNKLAIIGRDEHEMLRRPSALVDQAHEAGLAVHPWTFRAENAFLPTDCRSSGLPSERGELASELHRYARAGVDAVFTDQPDLAVIALRGCS
jgi:glycerophosphoryl diester phosphodiesterase